MSIWKSMFKHLFLFYLISNNLFSGQPYSLTREQEVLLFGFGSSIGISGFFLEDNVKPLTAEEITHLHKSDVNAFDRAACNNYNKSLGDISDAGVVSLMAAPALLFISNDIGGDFGTVSTMYLQTLMMIYALPSISKGSVTRNRPFVYNPDAPIEKKMEQDAVKSYFSGHTTAAFASAVFLSTVYSDYFPDSKYKSWIWAGSLIAAASIGYLRFESGNHYPTDIITGAIVGSAIGFLIPYLHRQADNSSPVSEKVNIRGYGINISFSF